MPIACAAVCIRGPITQPSLIALRIAMSSKFAAPRLRMDVKPASSVVRTFTTPRIAAKASTSRTLWSSAADDVRVRVDEAGKQCRVAEIHGTCACRDCDGSSCADTHDAIICHDDDA